MVIERIVLVFPHGKELGRRSWRHTHELNDNLKGKNNRKITYSCKIKLSTYKAIKVIFQQLYGTWKALWKKQQLLGSLSLLNLYSTLKKK